MTENIDKIDYKQWFQDLKSQIKKSQVRVSVSVNVQLILLYWELGKQIAEKQEQARWGSGLIDKLSKDLKIEFPEMTGLSRANLFRIVKFYKFYEPVMIKDVFVAQAVRQFKGDEKVAQLVRQIQCIDNQKDNQNEMTFPIFTLIPWGHNVLIIEKLKSIEEACFYVVATAQSRKVRIS